MRSRSGLALIFVVGVLAVLLVLGLAFALSVSLEFRASVAVRDLEDANCVADTGIHQAMSFLQYDVWGASEKQAFACAETRGTLHHETGVEFNPAEVLSEPDGSVAFFIRTPEGFKRIIRQAAKWRRPLTRVPIKPGSDQSQDRPILRLPPHDGQPDVRVVENDLSWAVNDSETYKRKGAPENLSGLDGFDGVAEAERIPVLSGAPFHDEFLPGPLDNSDHWELRTHLNRVLPGGASHFGGRNVNNEHLETGGAWSDNGWQGHAWAWPAMRQFEEFDLVDTRISGDAVFRLFRSDLIAATDAGGGGLSFESGVDPEAVSREGISGFAALSPRRYLHDKKSAAAIHPRNQQRRLRYTHMGQVDSRYEDTRGNAANINQVNNNAVSERFVDADGMTYFYNEAKWIYVYQPDGSHGATLKRYAVTVVSECGMPNANFIGPPAEALNPALHESARTWGLEWYLKALDAGFSLRGGPLGLGTLKHLKSAETDWSRSAAERLNSYVRGKGVAPGAGPITSRAELNMILRKHVFAAADGKDTPERQRAADFLADQLSVHAYEYQLDHHWSADRLIIDRGRTVKYASSALDERSPNATGSLTTRARLAEILDQLRFSWGPDEARESGEGWTPYHLLSGTDIAQRTQARSSKAGSIAWLLSASQDCGVNSEWVSPYHPEWWRQTIGENEQELRPALSDHKPDHAVGIKSDSFEYKDRIGAADVLWQQETGWVNAHAWALRISEVGRVQPRAFAELAPEIEAGATYALPEKEGRNGWKFDGEKEYWFVEIAANVSDSSAPLRQRLNDESAGHWPRHWQLLVMNRSGSNPIQCDVMKLPGTRVICVDLAADPTLPKNHGGDASSSDSRKDASGMNRIKVFDNSDQTGGDVAHDAMQMTRPAVATLNRLMWRWRADMPKPLTMRDIASEAGESSRREVAWRDSFSRAHPANYMVIVFDPAELPENTTGQQVRWCCYRSNSLTQSVVLDAVDFPDTSKPFEEGWEAVDLRNSRDARLAWKRAGAYGPPDSAAYSPKDGALPHAPLACLDCAGQRQGAYKKFSGSPAFRFMTRGEGTSYNWCDGLNEHAIGHASAGGEKNWMPAQQKYVRDDIEGRSGARAWPFAAANEAAATAGTYGISRGLLQFSCDMEKVPLGWFSYMHSATDDAAEIPDADLRSWGDLMRVTPLEQCITFGYLRGEAWGKPLTEDMYWLYPATDGLDNDLDGTIDRMTATAAHAGISDGRYVSDRKVVGRVNINEATNLAVLWYAGLGVSPRPDGTLPAQNLTPVLGRKPHKGYVSWREVFTRLNLQTNENTPYNALIWTDNLYADLSVDHAHAEEQYENLSQKRMSVARTLTVSHSPVYTIYCTAQTVDRLGNVRAQVRVRATVERTAEGRMNILEYAPIKAP
jgi:hypothetical protein